MSTEVRIGINGFGRIGRAVLRSVLERHPNIELVAINDPAPAHYIAQLLMYDSVYGRFSGVVNIHDDELWADGRRIAVGWKPEPADIGWGMFGVDVVIEASGKFLTSLAAGGHIRAGAKKVVMSAPAKDDTPTFVYGVNHERYDGQAIVSNASCTTNCLAVLAKVLHEEFGIRRALTTTVHSATIDQYAVDGAHASAWRSGRATLGNTIPMTTESPRAVGTVLPALRGKLTGVSYRVPASVVSLIDMTVELERTGSYDAICQAMRDASIGRMEGVLGYTEDEIVSSDLRGDSCSAIFDSRAGLSVDSTFAKVVAWYDNEYGYASRIADMVMTIASRG